MKDNRRVNRMFGHILGKIQIRKNGFTRAVSEPVLIRNIENKPVPGDPRADAEPKKIVRPALCRSWIVKQTTPKRNYIFGFQEYLIQGAEHYPLLLMVSMLA